jgi:xylulokinase
MEAILVFDAGRSQCRASYVARDGSIIASTESAYSTVSLADWVEQEPRDWYFALYIALKALLEKAPDVKPVAITVTGQSQLLFLAGDNDRMNVAIMAEDRRAATEWQTMVDVIGLEQLVRSSTIIHEQSSPIAKLMWLKKHQTSEYEQGRTVFFAAHDYLAFRICGARVTDFTSASYTDLFSLQENTWAIELLQSLDLRTDCLPELVKPGTRVGELNAETADTLKLPVGLPVYHGVSDLATMMTGAGVHQSNQYLCYLGKSGWLATTGLKQLVDPMTGLLNLRDPQKEQLLVTGQMLMAAGCFDWVVDRFGQAEEKAFADANLPLTELFMTLAAEAVPGSGGVIFLPYLDGEQAPFRDPNARGGWFHVTRKTWRSDLYRAVLEGVVYSMRAIQLLTPEPEVEADPILRLVGDESCSPLWAQIFADVFDCRVDVITPSGDVTARGAAYPVGQQLGWFANEVPPDEWLHISATYTPDENRVKIYEKMFTIYYQLYPALHSSFADMAKKD